MHNIQPKQRWQNSSGERVTVVTAVFNRVSFIRDGFNSPCTWPEQRFVKEFTPAQEVSHG